MLPIILMEAIIMVYIVVKQPPIYHQMTLEEFLFKTTTVPGVINENLANTRTYATETVSANLSRKLNFNIDKLINILEEFNNFTEEMRRKPRRSLYYEFYIPKKSGGLRKIDAPNDDLMFALRKLKKIFEDDFRALYHTSAFAYVKKRSTIDAVKKHQSNESKWFAKYDLHNFFGSTTLDFIMKMFSMVYPFSEVVKTDRGMTALRTALELAILDGGLPQGTPISPLITNIMMIPIDFKLTNELRDYDRQRYIYTRYADDFIISSKYNFDHKRIEKYIIDTLNEFGAPFTINEKKTRYGSSAGSNWNLGVMLNSNNEITVGYKEKRRFQAMLTSYVLDKRNGNPWDLHDIQVLNGLKNYYIMVEGKNIRQLISHMSEKLGTNIEKSIHEDLKI